MISAVTMIVNAIFIVWTRKHCAAVFIDLPQLMIYCFFRHYLRFDSTDCGCYDVDYHLDGDNAERVTDYKYLCTA